MTKCTNSEIKNKTSPVEAVWTWIKENIPILSLIVSLLLLYNNIGSRILYVNDHLGDKIDRKFDIVNQEISLGIKENQKLLILIARDFNKRINNTNDRIDRIYRAPHIKQFSQPTTNI